MKLLLLRCPNCAQPLQPENDDIVVHCEQCLSAVQIGDQGLQIIELQYGLLPGHSPGRSWAPFWIMEANVKLIQRQTQEGNYRNQGQAEQFWSEPRQLYVPAWSINMDAAQSIGARLTTQQQSLQTIERPEGATAVTTTVTAEDARKLIEFVILAIEARRPDYLRKLTFNLELLEQPTLWALPGKSYNISI